MFLSIGNANIDYFFVVKRMPREDEEVEAVNFYVEPGGSASNVAVALARLGMSSRILCCIGNDLEGKFLLNEFNKEHVDTRYIKVVDYVATGRVFIILTEGGKRMIAYRGANKLLSANDLYDEVFREIEHVHVSGGKPEIALRAFSMAKSLSKATTSYDPGSTIARRGLGELSSIIAYTDYLFLNELELEYLLKGAQISDLLKINPRVQIILKRGARGSALILSGRRVEAEAFNVRVVDVTGAGDAFDAGYMAAVKMGLEPWERLIFANAVAGIKVSRRGARSSPKLSEVVEFLREKGLSDLAKKVRS
ncbi:MAG: carbohydrate kinase family protein [Thermoprotei archaeon]|nr:MAG: carbohydrate kinase family protein [Thermoprotei archaeon]RLE98000.1 MAG: carbohydrate kinase family protein [Thermoprotei archaeon]